MADREFIRGPQRIDCGDITDPHFRYFQEVARNINKLRTQRFVSHADGAPCVDETMFDADANISEGSWESVGPTGSGADNVWTALDAIPKDVNWVELKVVITGTSASDSAQANRLLIVYARDSSSSEAIAGLTSVARCGATVNAAGNAYASSLAFPKVPVTNRTFDLYWASTFNSTNAVHVYLTGCGY